MLAGRPHEAAGNGSPRWMTAAPRERGTEPGLQAGSPTFHQSDLWRSGRLEAISLVGDYGAAAAHTSTASAHGHTMATGDTAKRRSANAGGAEVDA